jgi:hypothetical protein
MDLLSPRRSAVDDSGIEKGTEPRMHTDLHGWSFQNEIGVNLCASVVPWVSGQRIGRRNGGVGIQTCTLALWLRRIKIDNEPAIVPMLPVSKRLGDSRHFDSPHKERNHDRLIEISEKARPITA